MKKHIKSIAAFCAMTMIFGMFSATAFAGNEEPASNDPAVVEILDDTQEQATPAQGPEITQTSINANGKHLPVVSGTYTLMEDVTVESTAQIEEDGAVISIDLNGHTITYSGSGSMYIVGKVNGWTIDAGNVELEIHDSSSNRSGLITVSNNYVGGGSTDHWISGGIGTKDNRGGCVLVQNSSKFILNSGTINGFYAGDEGGAVLVSNGAFFEMNGGKITNCEAGNAGGAVSVNCSSNGISKTNNGITYCIQASAWIRGGEISGNKATNLGGGIRNNRANLYLSDCVIKNNTVTNGASDSVNGGGGIQILKDNKITQTIEIKGNVQIYDNVCTANPNRSNLFLDSATVTLGGDLDSTAKIAFGNKSNSTDKDLIYINGYDYDIDNFLCDNSSYVPVYNSGSKAIRMATATAPVFDSMNVSIAGNIALNIRVNLKSFANANTTISYAYSYVKAGQTKNVTKTLAFSALEQDGNLYTFTIPVESACMTAPISVAINYGANGKVTPANTITIENYAKEVINGSYPQKSKDIAEALVYFGGYAQVQFEVNTDSLPTLNNRDYTQPFADAISGEAYAPDSAFAGATLSMLSENNINLFFYKADLGSTAPAMTVDFGNGSETVQGKKNGSYYVYTIKGPTGTGFAANQYKTTFTFEVNGISGEYSVFTYLKAAKANTNNTQALVNLVEAYYNFARVCSNEV